MLNREINVPSECLPEAVATCMATFAAVSTIRCRRTSGVHRKGSDQGRPCSVHCQCTDATLVSRESPPPPSVASVARTASHIADRGEFAREGCPGGRGEAGLAPSIYRRKGVREGRVSIVRVKGPSDMEAHGKEKDCES